MNKQFLIELDPPQPLPTPAPLRPFPSPTPHIPVDPNHDPTSFLGEKLSLTCKKHKLKLVVRRK